MKKLMVAALVLLVLSVVSAQAKETLVSSHRYAIDNGGYCIKSLYINERGQTFNKTNCRFGKKKKTKTTYTKVGGSPSKSNRVSSTSKRTYTMKPKGF